MKNALILHGTNGSSQENWFPWLGIELLGNDFAVWTPNLPNADKPNIETYNKCILGNQDWVFDNESILVGHSSGAVAILGLLQALPEHITVDTCYLVGAFKNDLGWDTLTELFTTPFDFDYIKARAKKFVFIHSDDDPYCPLEHAEYLSTQLDGELHIMKGQKHFSVGTSGEKYRRFPELLDLILKDSHD